MESTDIRDEAKRMVDRMPPHSTWDDLIHEFYVRKAIDRGIADSEAGRVTSVSDVRQRFGLAE